MLSLPPSSGLIRTIFRSRFKRTRLRFIQTDRGSWPVHTILPSEKIWQTSKLSVGPIQRRSTPGAPEDTARKAGPGDAGGGTALDQNLSPQGEDFKVTTARSAS